MTMTLYTGQGPQYPDMKDAFGTSGPALATAATLDAVGEQAIMIGNVWIDGVPSGTKTISTGGSVGKIHFLPGTITWATAGTTLRVGIQDMNLAAGPPGRGDGTFDVYGDLVQGTDALTASTMKSVTMSSGTKSIAHGDLLAVIVEMTVRNGADSVGVQGNSTVNSSGLPGCTSFLGGTYAAQSDVPICVIEFDDGTLGTFVGTIPFQSASTEAWTNATNPNERGIGFRLQAPIKVGELIGFFGLQGATGDFDIIVYSDPYGTPASMYSASFNAEVFPQTFVYRRASKLIASGSELTLTAGYRGRDYCTANYIVCQQRPPFHSSERPVYAKDFKKFSGGIYATEYHYSPDVGASIAF